MLSVTGEEDGLTSWLGSTSGVEADMTLKAGDCGMYG